MKFNKIIIPNILSHFRGWSWIIETIKNDLIDPSSNFTLNSFVDSCFWSQEKDQNISSYWVGIVHSVKTDVDNLGGQTLENLVKHPWFVKNKHKCKKLITLTKYTSEALQSLTEIPVTYLYHPKMCEHFFDINIFCHNPRLNQAGSHMRDFSKFINFNTTIKKELYLGRPWFENRSLLRESAHNIQIFRTFLNDVDYIHNLITSVGFSYYSDIAASNSLTEHIVSHTPIVVNKHPAVIEYIGEKYPLFYEDIQYNPDKYLLDKSYIQNVSDYLKDRSKFSIFEIETFKKGILELEI
jgi:hypothetical protein